MRQWGYSTKDACAVRLIKEVLYKKDELPLCSPAAGLRTCRRRSTDNLY